MISTKNLSLEFKDKKLLTGINTNFEKGSLTAMIGRNGSGKSSFLKVLCGISDCYSGEILIGNENISKLSPAEMSRILSYVNTRRPRLANLKCRDVVALGRSPYTGWDGKLKTNDYNIVEQALDLVGMREYADRYFNTLSDGESQKIMIARAIAQDTDVIILDEPTSFLDLPTRYELVSLLKKLTKENEKTILFSTHELDIALKFADFIALIHDNQIYNLPVSEMKDSPLLSIFNPL